ncbi:MAG TPA: imidazole glycerol phosphate synthase subunit HisH [Deltaproteobacteria bacterium]|nr:imidazole glycerol phosphate synthase subunit HisH [Deltaproteobacteria bacterium]
MIAVIDYSMGNLRSVAKGLERVGAQARITRDPRVMAEASHLVLPGVGAFRDCMRKLDEYGLIDPLLRAIESGKPFLGICLGLQLLFEESLEFGRHKGLGLFKGRVTRFPSPLMEDSTELKVPHMGWNDISKVRENPLLEGIPDGTYFYFVHSYYCVPDEPDITLATTDYGVRFVSAVARDNITACQFHPEKSQQAGLRVLENFSRMG